MNPTLAVQATAFVLGLLLGSFLNVVIARLPRGESIVSPPSKCPRCKTRIHPWDNVPILSFVLLRGRCRSCRKRISWRYPVVELTAGVLLLLLTRRAESVALLVPQAAKALIGTKMDKAALDALAAACSTACKPIDDKRGTREFRIKVAGVLARRAAQIARKRAGGK